MNKKTLICLPMITFCLGLCFVLADSDYSGSAGAEDKAKGQESVKKVLLQGSIVDRQSGRPLAGRLYLQSASGEHFTVETASKEGSAVAYRKKRLTKSIEVHTALSAHPFQIRLPAGRYVVTVERGKEYLTERITVELSDKPVQLKIRLRRWIDMSKLGWYSGETHVHRKLEELPTAMLAEDLNVAFPLSYWVTQSYRAPSQGNRSAVPVKAELIKVDESHVIYPMNTEYELFTVDGKRHMQGAVFALNHRRPLGQAAPPTAHIAKQVRKEGGLLELDKHNWPWSMMIVPIMKVDLYELTNNHIWRTEFAFGDWAIQPPAYMNAERDENGMTERGWIDFTFQNYYALLNCGFRLRPTGGTASGVHPVPLGYGRVYVYLEDGFSYDGWVEGLDAGRSFVTTGPMLRATVEGKMPGVVFKQPTAGASYRVAGVAQSSKPLTRIEIIVAGETNKTIKPTNRKTKAGGYESSFEEQIEIEGSSWIAVRCYEKNGEHRERFAHTAPWHLESPGRPLRPRAEEIQFLVRRMEAEIARNEGVLTKEATAEYHKALEIYRQIARTARNSAE